MAGADPSFSEAHMWRTLFILDSEVTGRKKLVKHLGVGEGSVRTILKRLTAEGLLSSSKQGHGLSEAGRLRIESMLSKMSKPARFDSGGLVAGCQSLIIVYGVGGRVGGAVPLRDVALKAGADGAVILVYDGGLRFPDSGMDLKDYSQALERFAKVALRDGDVAVVGFGKTQETAEDGAVAVALELSK